MKQQVDELDATPKKRVFLSIIADYSLNTGVCELVDNALDAWNQRGKKGKLTVRISIDQEQRTITISDSAGGIPKEELHFVVGPGLTGNDVKADTIGIFGVGSKRAVVALAKDVKIRTRFGKGMTHIVEFDESWMQEDSWKLPVFTDGAIDPDSTVIALQQLRVKTDQEDLEALRDHLARTYSRFIAEGDMDLIFENFGSNPLSAPSNPPWAFPPGFEPRNYVGKLKVPDEGEVNVEILAGLMRQSSPSGDYGVYLYCNKRLVFEAKKDFSVGFGPGLAGLPHPSVSLMRVVVSLRGPAGLMPWNSTKTDVNMAHPVYEGIRGQLLAIVKDFSAVSRRYQGDWDNQVFRHDKGAIKTVQVSDVSTSRKTHLPKLPQAVGRYDEKVKQENTKIVTDRPWTRGLYEGVLAAEQIYRKAKFQQKNRICLIVLDSSLEIGFKEYLLKEKNLNLKDDGIKNLFLHRKSVMTAMREHAPAVAKKDWKVVEHFYELRCSLIHERATATVSDEDIEHLKAVTVKILGKLFGLRFSALKAD